MTAKAAPRLAKWPFFLGDLLLIVLAAVIVEYSKKPLELWQIVAMLAAVALGAWFAILPFLKQHEADLRFAEADQLADTVSQIGQLETVQAQIGAATGSWQTAQQQAAQTVDAAKQVADRMKRETEEFFKFLENRDETERSHLRLEVDKLRRSEGEWLQITVRILDHVFALHQAAVRSGQQPLIAQLTQFQMACRDAARRVGLVPFAAAANEPFEPKLHQPADHKVQPSTGAKIAETLAPGFTFQGQLIRRALVTFQQDIPGPESFAPAEHAANFTTFVEPSGAPSEAPAADTAQSAPSNEAPAAADDGERNQESTAADSAPDTLRTSASIIDDSARTVLSPGEKRREESASAATTAEMDEGDSNVPDKSGRHQAQKSSSKKHAGSAQTELF